MRRADWSVVGPLIACALLLGAGGFARAAEPGPGELQRDVVFSDYSPLSRSEEVARRMLTPLAAEAVRRKLRASGSALVEQSVDLKGERFVVYVPARRPPEGYGLLVFVPPWNQAALPDGWARALDREGVIYVSAARSGNEENVLGRRAPLALLGAENVLRRYPVDRRRIYVGGFSGGSRVALRLALAYPDLFRGAFLNAGSDPIGDAGAPLPSPELFARFQDDTRLVLATGAEDAVSLSMDGASVASLRGWCVSNVKVRVIPFARHQPASASTLDDALQAFDAPARPADQSRCRAARGAELAAGVDEVRGLIAKGERAAARRRLHELDARFGGLADRALVELADACGCDVFGE